MIQWLEMCRGDNCNIRKFCLRFRAVPEKHNQIWVSPKQNNPDDCDDFWGKTVDDEVAEFNHNINDHSDTADNSR